MRTNQSEEVTRLSREHELSRPTGSGSFAKSRAGLWGDRSYSAATAHRGELVSPALIEVRQPASDSDRARAHPLPFSGLVNAIEGVQSLLRDHPVLARRTKFAAWLVAVTAISFCWFIG